MGITETETETEDRGVTGSLPEGAVENSPAVERPLELPTRSAPLLRTASNDPELPDRPASQPIAAAGNSPATPPTGEPLDGLRAMLEAYPLAGEALDGIHHLAGKRNWLEDSIRQRFVYVEGDPRAMPHQILSGLSLEERMRLTAVALVEYRTKNETWDLPCFGGFVRRCRDQRKHEPPPASSETMAHHAQQTASVIASEASRAADIEERARAVTAWYEGLGEEAKAAIADQVVRRLKGMGFGTGHGPPRGVVLSITNVVKDEFYDREKGVRGAA